MPIWLRRLLGMVAGLVVLGLLIGSYLSFDVFYEHISWSNALGDLGCFTMLFIVGGIVFEKVVRPKKSTGSTD